MKRLTVVVPAKEQLTRPNPTLDTLDFQTYRDFNVVVQVDQGMGSNWARNRGFELCKSELVLFCDDDIHWTRDALEVMVGCLDQHSEASFCYCSYKLDDKVWCTRDYDDKTLRLINYISTMSVIRTAHFPGFDENIRRLQDWDLWLMMLREGHTGVWCGRLCFETYHRQGITFGNSLTWQQAVDLVKAKHKDWL